MERYRSGHNGADSKSVWEQSHEGSNPSLSARKEVPFVYRTKGTFSMISVSCGRLHQHRKKRINKVVVNYKKMKRRAKNEFESCRYVKILGP